MENARVRYLGEVFVAFVMVVFVAGIGSILGLTLYPTRLRIPLLLFVGPTYLFFILPGSGPGYVVNRRQPGCPMGMDSGHDLVCICDRR